MANTILQLRVKGQEGIVINEVSFANRDALPDEPKTRWFDQDQACQWWQNEGKRAQLNLVRRRNIQNRHSDEVIIYFKIVNETKVLDNWEVPTTSLELGASIVPVTDLELSY